MRSGALLAAVAGMAMLVSACVDDDGPFARRDNVLYDKALLVPDHITPPVKVLPVEGAPEHWRLHERVASALREREIPAGTEGESGASYTLRGQFSVPEKNDGRVRIAWQLHDNAGSTVGEVMQMTAITNAAWGTRETGELGMVSQAAAESLAPLVPSAALDDTQFAENTGEPSTDDPSKRFGPVTALARKSDMGGGGLGDRFVGLAEVDRVPALPASAAALGIEPDPEVAKQAEEEAARKAALPPAEMPTLPEADRVPGPGYDIPQSTFGIEPDPDADPNEALGPGNAGSAAPSGAEQAAGSGTENAPAQLGGLEGSGVAPPTASATAEGSVPPGLAPYWVQLGAYRDLGQGEAAWAALAAEHPRLLKDEPHAIHEADLASSGVFYRVKLGPYAVRDRALDACAGLSRAGVDCFITRDAVAMVANAGYGPEEDRTPARNTGLSGDPASGAAAGSDGGRSALAHPTTPVTSGPTVAEPPKPVTSAMPVAAAEPEEAEPRAATPPARYVEIDKDGARVRGYLGIPGVTD